MIETVRQELRYGIRSLRSSATVTVLVVGILAVVIGANTAVFSVINTVIAQTVAVSRR